MIVVIQDKVFGEETDRLVAALKKLGVRYSFDDLPPITGGEAVFFRGTTKFVRTCLMRYDEYADVVGSMELENYQYHVYSQHYIDVLLNSDYAIYPWWYLKTLQSVPPMFLRPVSGEKIFTGTTVGNKYYQQELRIIETLPSTSGLTDETLVVTSSPKEILAEFRLVMCENDCLGWSRYDENSGNYSLDKHIPGILKWFKWYPDPFYTADVAITPNGCKLVELNSFASAGWYDVDPEPIVRKLLEDCPYEC